MLFCKTPAFATVFLLKGFLLYLEGFRRFRTENSGVAQKLKKAHGEKWFCSAKSATGICPICLTPTEAKGHHIISYSWQFKCHRFARSVFGHIKIKPVQQVSFSGPGGSIGRSKSDAGGYWRLWVFGGRAGAVPQSGKLRFHLNCLIILLRIRLLSPEGIWMNIVNGFNPILCPLFKKDCFGFGSKLDPYSTT